MRRYPYARQQEFAQAIAAARLSPGLVVADVPAGGGVPGAPLAVGLPVVGTRALCELLPSRSADRAGGPIVATTMDERFG